MNQLTDFLPDELLIQASCTVLVDGKIRGTAWLASAEGHLVTAGHILGTDTPYHEKIEVCFSEDTRRMAHKVLWGYQREMGVDYAILKLDSPLPGRRPLPISLSKSVTGTFKVYGYGKSLQYLSVGTGQFLGAYDWQNSQNNRVFLLDSKQLGEGGYSGAAIFSNELQAVVAVQTGATQTITGPGRDTILAMPLYRIPPIWAENVAGRQNYLKWRLEDVNNRLKTSIHRARFIDLSLAERSGVTLPWTYKTFDPYSVPKIFVNFEEAFNYCKQHVLLLGSPGSGKTTTLIALTKNLLEKAVIDQSAPIPLLFNLSQWENENQSIADWLVMLIDNLPIEKLSKEIAQSWVNEGNIVLLLDGLDEVAQSRRDKIITVLNEYLRIHPNTPAVICSRMTEYESLQKNLETRLRLDGAVTLQPLEREQIDAYLIATDATALRDALLENTDLYELARIPLTLSMMTLAYGSFTPEQIPIDLSLVERRAHLFDTYIDRMMQRKARRDAQNPDFHTEELNPYEVLPTSYSREQVNRYLGWLAIRLSEQEHTVFPLKGIFRFLEDSPDKRVWNTVGVTNAITMSLIGAALGISWLVGSTKDSITTLDQIILILLSGVAIGGGHLALQRVTQTLTRSSSLRTIKVIYFVFLFMLTWLALDTVYLDHTLLEAFTRIPIIGIVSVSSSGLVNAFINKSRGTVRAGGLAGAFLGLAVSALVGTNINILTKFIIGVICGILSGSIITWYSKLHESFVEERLFNNIARFLLIMRGYIPQDFKAFLNYATDTLLLKQVGAEYEFIHRLLRDHFALQELMSRSHTLDETTRKLMMKRLSHLGETAYKVMEKITLPSDNTKTGIEK